MKIQPWQTSPHSHTRIHAHTPTHTPYPPHSPSLSPCSPVLDALCPFSLSSVSRPVVVTNPSLPLPLVRVNIYWPSLSVWLALCLQCPALLCTHTHTQSRNSLHKSTSQGGWNWDDMGRAKFVSEYLCERECVFLRCSCGCVRLFSGVCVHLRVCGNYVAQYRVCSTNQGVCTCAPVCRGLLLQ